MLIRKIHKLLKKRRQADAQRQFDAVSFARGDIVIDCGANVGDVVARVWKPGVKVFAFEPNPDAFEALTQRFKGNEDVVCLQHGVGAAPGSARLYMHRKYKQNPLRYSQASSMLNDKRNVRDVDAVDVEVVRLSEFIGSLGRRVKLLKLDIEGLEFEVMDDLIATGMLERIDHVFCETHELTVKRLWADLRSLKTYLRKNDIRHVCLDWK